MEIQTERLLLRDCTVEDITPAYVAALNDPAVVGLTEARHRSWDRAAVEEYVQKSNTPGSSQLIGLFIRPGGKHIGNIRLFNMHPVHRRAELGIMLFDSSEWGKGYASEALKAVVTYAFGTLGLHRIHADYYATNAASAAVFKKVGFTIEGTFKDHFRVKDGYVDSIRIAKLNDNV